MLEAGDTGSYTCVAENPAGSAEKHFALAVQGKASPLAWVTDLLPSSSFSTNWSFPWLWSCLCLPVLATLAPCEEAEVPKQARGSVGVISWGTIDLHTDGSPLALSFGCTAAEAPWSAGTEPENIDGIVNGSVSLVCDIRSHPAAEIAWYKDGHALRLGEGVTVTRDMSG